MSIEIERKFLVSGDGWQSLATSRHEIRQAYIAREGHASIRVRIVDGAAATLTIKSRTAGAQRLEFEYPVPLGDAQALLELRQGAVIEKQRARVPFGGLVWEVDTFAGDNTGLLIAEVELQSVDQAVALPPWSGREITGEEAYYNSALAAQPYNQWPMRNGVRIPPAIDLAR